MEPVLSRAATYTTSGRFLWLVITEYETCCDTDYDGEMEANSVDTTESDNFSVRIRNYRLTFRHFYWHTSSTTDGNEKFRSTTVHKISKQGPE